MTGIFPPDHGGPASYVPVIAAQLAARGHEIVAVITLSDSLADSVEFPFRVVRMLRGQPYWKRLPAVVARIRTLARQADVVYLNGLVLEGILACRMLSRRPVVVKVVGDLIWEKARNQRAFAGTLEEFQVARLPLRWRVLRRLQAGYTSLASLVICPSRYLAVVVRGWGVPAERIRVVHNAAESRDHAAVAGEAGPVFDVVTVARLVPWKGVDQLIDLCAEQGWSLLVVGDGPLRVQLEERARRAARQGSIAFTGHVASASVTAQMARAKVFVLNSNYEGLPHIVLEAKEAGLPVVATSAGGTPESINDGVDGLLVDVGDVEMLRRAIASLLADTGLRNRLGAAGRKDVEQRFSLATMAGNTEQVLATAAGGR